MKNKGESSMKKIQSELRKFTRSRNWDQFHSPKNLSMALTKECAELMEIFQWKTTDESEFPRLSNVDIYRIKEEVGDVIIYLTMLCDRLGIDPVQEGLNKIKENERKYPISKSINSNKKYLDLA